MRIPKDIRNLREVSRVSQRHQLSSGDIKQFTLRLPARLHEKLTEIAKEENITLAGLLVEATCDKYNIDCWRTGTQEEVAMAVEWAEKRTPNDVLEVIQQIQDRRKKRATEFEELENMIVLEDV